MQKYSLNIFISSIILALFGSLMIYSASSIWSEYKFNDEFYYLKRQLLFLVIGIIMMIIASRIDLFKLKRYLLHLFVLSLILLGLVLIPGIGQVRGGAQSWIGIGSFSLQPSEFVKVTIILLLARYLETNYKDLTKFRYFIYISLLYGIVFVLIMLQPDFGSATVILCGVYILLFVNLTPIKYFINLILTGIIALIPMIALAPYRLKRITSYLDPWSDPLGGGFQIIQSLYALVPHGIFGTGLFNSKQKFYYLPEPQTDFIFAIVVEELGLIGIVITIGLIINIILTAYKAGISTKNNYLKNIIIGLTSMFFVQVVINIFVCIGVIPVTGVTLPFISYGGSSLVINFIIMGILISAINSSTRSDYY